MIEFRPPQAVMGNHSNPTIRLLMAYGLASAVLLVFGSFRKSGALLQSPDTRALVRKIPHTKGPPICRNSHLLRPIYWGRPPGQPRGYQRRHRCRAPEPGRISSFKGPLLCLGYSPTPMAVPRYGSCHHMIALISRDPIYGKGCRQNLPSLGDQYGIPGWKRKNSGLKPSLCGLFGCLLCFLPPAIE